ncbi:MAG: tetratricopeptide repeat protein [Desulfarculus sp.]|nr:tetratricopeptide repeat protein [Desulfarculus sp.]
MKYAYRRMSVLLVDSTTVAADAMEGHLEPLQFHRIWAAKTAEEAMHMLRERPADLVVTNWKLQPITGLQLLEMIRRDPKLRSLPVVVLRSPKDKHIEEKAEGLGATALADLPIKPSDFLEVVEQALSPLIDDKEEEFLRQMDLARGAIRTGDLDLAEKAYRAALAVKVDEEAQVGLGKVLKKLGDWEGAEQAYVAALKANPYSLRAFLGLASVYQSCGRLEDALKVLAGAVNAAKKVKEAGSVQAVLYFYMGEIELQLKRLQQALGLFDKAVQEAPEDAPLQGRIGDSLVKEGFLAEAESYYQRALEIDPELAHVYNRLGIAYRRQQKFDMAISLYQKALHFHPRDEHLLYNMARCFWEMEEWQQAAEILTQAMEINPQFTAAQQLLDACLQNLGFKKSAGAKADLDKKG